MPKILFIVNHRLGRSPSQRFRIEHYLDFFVKEGFDYSYSNIISEHDDEILYSKGQYIKKTLIFFKSYFIRFKDVFNVFHGKFDIVFVHREALLTGSSMFEWLFSKTKAKLIFDFDDAIWLPNVSSQNKKLEWIKNYSKTSKIISYADVVIAGNNYLKEYALKYNSSVIVIPTTINTNYHVKKKINKTAICIGWTGSITTIKHFDLLVNTLFQLKKKYNTAIYFKVIGDKNYSNKELEINGVEWNKESEIEDLSEIDIGIMPLPNDKWSMGKCAFKALQYMSLEIPCIISPVGVNTELIEHEKNGYLANSEEEWIQYLSLLIENPEMRNLIGKEGRNTIIKNYSVNSQKDKYIFILKEK